MWAGWIIYIYIYPHCILIFVASILIIHEINVPAKSQASATSLSLLSVPWAFSCPSWALAVARRAMARARAIGPWLLTLAEVPFGKLT